MLDSTLLYFGLQRRLRATVLLTLLDMVSSQSPICVAHQSFLYPAIEPSHKQIAAILGYILGFILLEERQDGVWAKSYLGVF